MNKENKNYKIKICKIILPLLHATLKRPDFKLSSIFSSVDKISDELIIDLKRDHNSFGLSNSELKIELMELISISASHEIIYNKSEYFEEIKDHIKELLFSLSNEKNNLFIDKKKNSSLSMINIFSEINKFHSLLYFSGYINFSTLKEINNNILKNANSNIHYLIKYLKNDNINDTNYIYDIINIATIIYADILNGLFINLSKDESKMKDYIKNQSNYIIKTENIFIEQYSILNSSCNNIIKKIEK